MTIFSEVRLKWKGREYVIPSDGVMMAIAKVEEFITLQELSLNAQKKTIQLAKLSQAYAAILQYAGAEVTPDEVYGGMFDRTDTAQVNAQTAVTTLLVLMLPPKHLQQTAEEISEQGKVVAAGVPLSKKRTK